MKAVVFRKYKSLDSLELIEIQKPEPRDNEVLVKIHAASVNSWDWDLLNGIPFANRIEFGLTRPGEKIIGLDIAGQVEQAGKKANDFRAGDMVFGDISACGMGAFAEYVCVPEKFLAYKPDKMTFEVAAALPHTGVLALQGLRDKGQVKKGHKVLVNGAGGGSGTMAIQIARSYGAEVTAIDKGTKLDMLLSLGADQVIDYTAEDFIRKGKLYDVILDVVSFRSIFDYRRMLNPGGKYVMLGGGSYRRVFQCFFLGPLITGAEGISKGKKGRKLGLMMHKPNRNDLNILAGLFEAGTAAPVIDRSYKLEEVREAFQYYGQGQARGKVIITVN